MAYNSKTTEFWRNNNELKNNVRFQLYYVYKFQPDWVRNNRDSIFESCR